MQDVPPPPPGFEIDDEPKPRAKPQASERRVAEALIASGQVYDGDTFRLTSGPNARLFGVDAFERRQQVKTPDGTFIPIGEEARGRLEGFAIPSAAVTPTGGRTYGRPVVTLEEGGEDAGERLLREGYGLAAPEYLKADPARLSEYMEAERLARLNRLGAHGNTYQTPQSHRQGNPDPWAKPEPGSAGDAVAVFWDEPTPFQGLREDIAEGWVALHKNPNSTAADIIGYAKQHGFNVDPDDVNRFIRERTEQPERAVAGEVTYREPTKLLTKGPGGQLGALNRGVLDPINFLDEGGALLQSVGLGPDRENVWNSERRFGDVLWNNIGQNRAILGHDEQEYPWTRFSGQVASGVLLPGSALEGVGLRAATAVLREGGTRMAAVQAAKSALRRQAAIAGGVEGGLAGVGSGEDWSERAANGIVGTLLGAGLGGGGTAAFQAGGDLISGVGRAGQRAAAENPVAEALLDGAGRPAQTVQEPPPPPPGFEIDQDVAAMRVEHDNLTLLGPRDVDRIDVSPASPPRPLTPAEQVASANVPDAGAIVAGEGPPNARAGNINLANLDSPENIDRALNAASDVTGGFADSRRGVVSQAETERLAADMGMTADDLLKRRKGQALNAEQALAARQILAKSGDELVTLAQRVQGMDNPGDELLAQFRQAWVRHVAIQEQLAGATAEAGRALSQFRMMADSRLAKGQVLGGLVHEGGGADRLRDAARIIVDSAHDPSALNRVTARALKPKFSDKLVELWYNSLLSGPQTHAVNVMSNTMTSLAQIPEHAIAAGIGGIRRMLPSQQETDAVMFSELGARATGLLQGIKEGLPQAWRTMRTGEPSDFVSKVETRYPSAISGVKGSVIRTPTRALAAEDELFKSMARRMELGGLAVRQAAKEGLSGEAGKARAAELMANPTDEMLERAFDYGQYLTFQADLGPVGQGVQRITQSMPVLKLVLPFIKTPTNLLKFTLERSPAAPLLKE